MPARLQLVAKLDVVLVVTGTLLLAEGDSDARSYRNSEGSKADLVLLSFRRRTVWDALSFYADQQL